MTWHLEVTMTAAGHKQYTKRIILVPFKKIKKIKHQKEAEAYAWTLYEKLVGASKPRMVWDVPLEREHV